MSEYTKVDMNKLEFFVPLPSAVFGPPLSGSKFANFSYGNDELPFDARDEMSKLNFALLTNRNNSDIPNAPSLKPTEEFLAKMLGPFNEIEYSANLTFAYPPRIDEMGRGIHRGSRAYYKRKVPVSVPPDDTFLVDVVMRMDDSPSAKLKALKRRIDVGGLRIKWTAAIEVPVPEISVIRNAPKREHKRLDTIYWNLVVRPAGRPLVFRVAFHDDHRFRHVRCNIECESRISLELFTIIYHMLALYYITQFDEFDGKIHPICEKLRSLPGLTECQRRIAETVELHERFAPEEELTGEPETQVSPDMAALVKFAAIGSYLSYGEDDMAVGVQSDAWDRGYERPMIRHPKTGIDTTKTELVYAYNI